MYYACRLEVNLRDKIPSTRSGLFTNSDYPVFRMQFRTYSIIQTFGIFNYTYLNFMFSQYSYTNNIKYVHKV